MRSYLGAEDLNIRDCALEGFELFGSTKRKLDLPPPGSEYDSHRPDKVNYSIPHPNKRPTKARIDTSFEHDENVVSYTTNVLGTDCPKSKWYISRLLYPSKQECQALQEIIDHSCRVKVGKSTHGTPAPTDTSVKKEFLSNNHVPSNFMFFADDINRCVKGSKRKWVFDWPNLP